MEIGATAYNDNVLKHFGSTAEALSKLSANAYILMYECNPIAELAALYGNDQITRPANRTFIYLTFSDDNSSFDIGLDTTNPTSEDPSANFDAVFVPVDAMEEVEQSAGAGNGEIEHRQEEEVDASKVRRFRSHSQAIVVKPGRTQTLTPSQTLVTGDNPVDQGCLEHEGLDAPGESLVAIFTRVRSEHKPPSVPACIALAEEALSRVVDLSLVSKDDRTMVALRFGSATQGPAEWSSHATVQLHNQPIVVATELLRTGGRMIIQGVTGFTTKLNSLIAFLECITMPTTIEFLFADDRVVLFSRHDKLLSSARDFRQCNHSAFEGVEQTESSDDVMDLITAMMEFRRQLAKEANEPFSAADIIN